MTARSILREEPRDDAALAAAAVEAEVAAPEDFRFAAGFGFAAAGFGFTTEGEKAEPELEPRPEPAEAEAELDEDEEDEEDDAELAPPRLGFFERRWSPSPPEPPPCSSPLPSLATIAFDRFAPALLRHFSCFLCRFAFDGRPRFLNTKGGVLRSSDSSDDMSGRSMMLMRANSSAAPAEVSLGATIFCTSTPRRTAVASTCAQIRPVFSGTPQVQVAFTRVCGE